MLAVLMICLGLQFRLGKTYSAEDLIVNLLQNYSKIYRLARPTLNSSEPTVIHLGVDLQHILNVDEKSEILEISVWLKYRWFDYKLVWDPANYSGVTDVRFPLGALWSPDVLLHNSADARFDAAYPSNLVVYNDGTVSWIPPAILKASCKIDITWFPFDDQSCFFKFGSWSYHGFTMDLRAEDPEHGMATAEYIENGEWILLSTPVIRTERTYDCCREPYPDLKFYLNIRRRTRYYVFNLMIPSLLMSFMTILGFTLPPDACEKITLEITILLTVYVFLTMVADMSPPTSETVPLIGIFFCCCLMLVSASVLFSVLVLNLHFQSAATHEMTPFVQKFLINWLPWILRVKRPGKPLKKVLLCDCGCGKIDHSESFLQLGACLLEESMLSSSSANDDPTDLVQQMMESGGSMDVNGRVDFFIKKYLETPTNQDSQWHSMVRALCDVHKELKVVTTKMADEDEDIKIESDWKFAAIVVDRFCLIVFSVLTIATTLVLFGAPYLARLDHS